MSKTMLPCCGIYIGLPAWSLWRRNPRNTASASAAIRRDDVDSNAAGMSRIADELGPKLYKACLQNNVTQVDTLMAEDWIDHKWSAAVLAAACMKAINVVSYCKQQCNWLDTSDQILWKVLGCESLYPAYFFLVDSGLIHVNHGIDRTGPLLSVAAGMPEYGRHFLVKFLLTRGADPSHRSEMHGGANALAAAAGYSDRKMVELLLDHGAQIRGSGALALAARRGNFENIEYLLYRGADVNEMVETSSYSLSRQGVATALHEAVEYGRLDRLLDVVDMLLSAGADVTLIDGKGRTARDIAEGKGLGANVLTMLSAT